MLTTPVKETTKYHPSLPIHPHQSETDANHPNNPCPSHPLHRFIRSPFASKESKGSMFVLAKHAGSVESPEVCYNCDNRDKL